MDFTYQELVLKRSREIRKVAYMHCVDLAEAMVYNGGLPKRYNQEVSDLLREVRLRALPMHGYDNIGIACPSCELTQPISKHWPGADKHCPSCNKRMYWGFEPGLYIGSLKPNEWTKVA